MSANFLEILEIFKGFINLRNLFLCMTDSSVGSTSLFPGPGERLPAQLGVMHLVNHLSRVPVMTLFLSKGFFWSSWDMLSSPWEISSWDTLL